MKTSLHLPTLLPIPLTPDKNTQTGKNTRMELTEIDNPTMWKNSKQNVVFNTFGIDETESGQPVWNGQTRQKTHLASRNRPYRIVKQAVLQCDMACFAMPNGMHCIPKKTENHLKKRAFRLVQSTNVLQTSRKTSHNKLYLWQLKL